MKTVKLFLTLTILTFVQVAFPQEMRRICGTMTDAEKMPLPGVTIQIKGTTTGVVSDINGKYCIDAPANAVLIYTYIGYINEEVPVGRIKSQPTTSSTSYQGSVSQSYQVYNPQSVKCSYTPIAVLPEFSLDADTDTLGTARFTYKTPTYKVNNPSSPWYAVLYDPSRISSINFNHNIVDVNIARDRYFKIPHITFTTSASIDNIARLPKRQEEFAQGRPVNGTSQWRGPETGEMLSWGPAISNLEFDGVPNAFDKNGSLVPKGLGNGNPARAYNPYDFFKTGFSLQNTLKVNLKEEKKEYGLVYNNKKIYGTLPNSTKTGNYIEFKLYRKYRNFNIKAQVVYDSYKSNLMSANPGMGLLMSAIETTPPTFDNFNGLSRKKAATNTEAYLLSDKTQRTYASGVSNNPFWLLNNLIDDEKKTVVTGYTEANYQITKYFTAFVNGTYEDQKLTNSFGYKGIPNGATEALAINRTDNLTSNKASGGLKYYIYNYKTSLFGELVYNYTKTDRSLNRSDKVSIEETPQAFVNQSTMETQNLGFTANLSHRNWLFARVCQNYQYAPFYKDNKLYSPSASMAINFREIRDLFYYLGDLEDIVENFKIRGTWGYVKSFSPLAYAYGEYNYQDIKSSQYANAEFEYELLPNPSLKPEKVLKKGIGLDLGMFRNQLTATFDFYDNKVYHGIFPQMQGNVPVLLNLADYTSKGFEMEMDYTFNTSYRHYNSSHLRFILSTNRTKVTGLGNNQEYLSLGGYNDAFTALVKDQPKGVIVGTAYKRNDKGQLIIDNDGYPVVDEKLHVLGNPNPDLTMGLEFKLNFNGVYLTTLFDAGIGGKKWNGTENTLSYLGLSDKTVDGRKVIEYVYPGVKLDGTPNTTPVDFANPSKPIEQNRWYRYGNTGVAEDGIQDASYFRVKQITLTFERFKGRVKKGISLFVENPIVITKYRGVSPEATLWGKSSTQGLDLFNLPSVWRIGLNFYISL